MGLYYYLGARGTLGSPFLFDFPAVAVFWLLASAREHDQEVWARKLPKPTTRTTYSYYLLLLSTTYSKEYLPMNQGLLALTDAQKVSLTTCKNFWARKKKKRRQKKKKQRRRDRNETVRTPLRRRRVCCVLCVCLIARFFFTPRESSSRSSFYYIYRRECVCWMLCAS